MLRSAAQTDALDGGRSVALCKVSAPGGCRNAPISPRGCQGARPSHHSHLSKEAFYAPRRPLETQNITSLEGDSFPHQACLKSHPRASHVAWTSYGPRRGIMSRSHAVCGSIAFWGNRHAVVALTQGAVPWPPTLWGRCCLSLGVACPEHAQNSAQRRGGSRGVGWSLSR